MDSTTDYPHNLRISTSTATCNINSFVNLYLVYSNLQINETIIYIEFADEIPKGINPGKPKSKKASDKKKLFYNQITIIVKPYSDKSIFNNVKLFNNGAVSMTGLKKQEGEISIQYILDKIKLIKGVIYSNSIHSLNSSNSLEGSINDQNCDFCSSNNSLHNIKKISCDHSICKLCIKNKDVTKTICPKCSKELIEDALVNNSISKIKDFKIVLINSDYYIGFNINREKLHNILYNKYQIYSSYEPCIYPGVNSKYYWNEDYFKNDYQGKCQCTVYCNGKGPGKGDGQCKKITISIFQSGSIIITGAHNHKQIITAYNFINNVINSDIQLIKKETNTLFDTNEKKKIVKLNKGNIINYPTEEHITKINVFNSLNG